VFPLVIGRDEILFGTSLAQNYDALEHTYVPKRLLHRTRFINELLRILGRALRGSTPPHLLLVGPPGSGKTISMLYVVEQLKRKIEGEGCRIAYTVASGSSYRVLVGLAESCGIRLPRRGISFEESRARFFSGLKEGVAIAVLDELDKTLKIDGEELIYHLSRRPRTCIVGISNLSTVLDLIRDKRVLSSFLPRRIVFPPYDAGQLEDILLDRIKVAGLKIDPLAVKACASMAVGRGSDGGDARYALDLLRYATDIAERAGAEQVMEEHVKIAEKEVEREYIYKQVTMMEPAEKRVLLLSIAETDPCTLSDAYERANRMAEAMGYGTYSLKRLSDFLRSLELEGFVRVRRRGRGRGMGVLWEVSVPPTLDRATLVATLKGLLPKFG
jgi:cell division control protein 6